MAVRYIRRVEFFEAVQFIRINKDDRIPKFHYLPEWIKFALDNRILQIEGEDLIWGYKGLDRRITPGSWILRSHKTGALKVRSDGEFKELFEIYQEDGIQ